MEKEVKEKKRVGCVIGRFQTPDLHAGHKHLFEEVMKRSDILIVLLGSTAAINTIEDPLPYGVRNQMVSQYLAFESELAWVVRELPNHPDDNEWSKNVDHALRGFSEDIVTLYGSRDSFIKVYNGVFPTVEIPEAIVISATEERKSVKPICSSQFRQGMVHAANIRYPQTFPTVDVAIFNRTGYKILLGRKPGETAWRFPGGFVDPTDNSLSYAAKRETKEETGLDVVAVNYVDSMLINDGRYRGRDKIMTTFFKCYIARESPEPVAGDDLEEVKWFDLSRSINVMPAHRELLERLLDEEGL